MEPLVQQARNEPERLRALHRYGVLDTPPDRALDELTALAAQICDTPIALISIVDEHRQAKPFTSEALSRKLREVLDR